MPRILIVDDDPDVASRMRQLLEPEHEVTLASDWSTVGSAAIRIKCDLVLMDVNLPTLQGDALVRILSRAGDAPKIVYFSSEDEQKLSRLVADTPADGYLLKSLRGGEILSRIEALLATP